MAHAPLALITGGSQRLGRALALALAQDGWRVAVHYWRSAAAAHALVEELNPITAGAVAVQADLRDPAAAAALLPMLTKTHGPCQLLINNASAFERDELLEFDPAIARQQLESNLLAPWQLIRDFSQLLPTSQQGSIINILDNRIYALDAHFISYSLSKVGLAALTSMAAAALPAHIRCSGLAPGPTLQHPRQSAAHFAKIAAATPAGIATPLPLLVAGMRWCRDQDITGEIYPLDGSMPLPFAA